ncbi:MAG: MmcQ/YjbR family DNA-binding protein [Roseiflexaceae bacterium]|nr:MmcQ/YjbR family DNA-binding protein [Roseiflexaceae bacterium]
MQTYDDVHGYVVARAGVSEGFPFGPGALVYKVVGKMFALLAVDQTPLSISLKCDPADAQFLRDTYAAVKAGYHLNKRHWNTLLLDGSVPDDVVRTMIDDSYRLVVKGLTRAERTSLD